MCHNYAIRAENLVELISSLNKRFDDLYILGSIIIVLLIAINIGAYISADSMMRKYLEEEIEGKITNYLNKLPGNGNTLPTGTKQTPKSGTP